MYNDLNMLRSILKATFCASFGFLLLTCVAFLRHVQAKILDWILHFKFHYSSRTLIGIKYG